MEEDQALVPRGQLSFHPELDHVSYLDLS